MSESTLGFVQFDLPDSIWLTQRLEVISDEQNAAATLEADKLDAVALAKHMADGGEAEESPKVGRPFCIDFRFWMSHFLAHPNLRASLGTQAMARDFDVAIVAAMREGGPVVVPYAAWKFIVGERDDEGLVGDPGKHGYPWIPNNRGERVDLPFELNLKFAEAARDISPYIRAKKKDGEL